MVDYFKNKKKWEREYRRYSTPPTPVRRDIDLTRDLRDPSGSSYSLKPRGRSVPNIGEVYKGQNSPALYRSPQRSWGSPENFVPRGIPRRMMFNMFFKNYDLFYDIGKSLYDYVNQLNGAGPVPISSEVSHMPSNPGATPYPDGFLYDYDVPSGWSECDLL